MRIPIYHPIKLPFIMSIDILLLYYSVQYNTNMGRHWKNLIEFETF